MKSTARQLIEQITGSQRGKERQLAPGLSWGDDFTWDDVKPGDRFVFTGSKRRGYSSGTIDKVSRMSIRYHSMFGMVPGKPKERMDHQTRKDEFYGGDVYIISDNKVHLIIE